MNVPASAPRVESTLRRLELDVFRRLDGLLQGDHLGLVPAPGTEAGESREYQVGDDVRRMDWPVTARTQVPHVRDTIADRELETWIVVDRSASLDFGTAQFEKRDIRPLITWFTRPAEPSESMRPTKTLTPRKASVSEPGM